MTDARSFTVDAVAVVRSLRVALEDDGWGGVESTIELLPPYGPASVRGLESFSHVEVLFLFDQVEPASVCTTSRHPRGNPDWPDVGIFAQRAKDRPNRLGVSTCELLGVEGASMRVRGLDAVDGTPVLDVKPYVAEFGPRGVVREPRWVQELTSRYYD